MTVWATDPPADPYFDHRLNAWVVSRYGDVAAALREPRLIPVLARSTSPAVSIDSAVHTEFREQALRALAPAAIRQWEERFARAANLLASMLPIGDPIDLVEQYAKPWSLQVAGIAADVPPDQCERLAILARSIFEAACEPYDEALATAAQKATVDLASFFCDAPPWTVQMFVALAHSLPALLGNLWLALIERPADIDELLRYAGPAKAQFRHTVAAVTIGDHTIPQDQLLILRLDIASHDPDQPPASGHLTFGAGLHACVGASLIKSAAVIATKALEDRFHFAGSPTAGTVDHFAMRYVRALTVTLSLASQNPNRIDPRCP
jgi:cytochrome P450